MTRDALGIGPRTIVGKPIHTFAENCFANWVSMIDDAVESVLMRQHREPGARGARSS